MLTASALLDVMVVVSLYTISTSNHKLNNLPM